MSEKKVFIFDLDKTLNTSKYNNNKDDLSKRIIKLLDKSFPEGTKNKLYIITSEQITPTPTDDFEEEKKDKIEKNVTDELYRKIGDILFYKNKDLGKYFYYNFSFGVSEDGFKYYLGYVKKLYNEVNEKYEKKKEKDFVEYVRSIDFDNIGIFNDIREKLAIAEKIYKNTDKTDYDIFKALEDLKEVRIKILELDIKIDKLDNNVDKEYIKLGEEELQELQGKIINTEYFNKEIDEECVFGHFIKNFNQYEKYYNNMSGFIKMFHVFDIKDKENVDWGDIYFISNKLEDYNAWKLLSPDEPGMNKMKYITGPNEKVFTGEVIKDLSNYSYGNDGVVPGKTKIKHLFDVKPGKVDEVIENITNM